MVEKICGKVEQYALGRSRMLSSRCWQPFRELEGVSNSHLILQQMPSSSCPLLPIHFHLGEITVVRASRFAVNLPYFPELTTRETKKSPCEVLRCWTSAMDDLGDQRTAHGDVLVV